MELVSVVIPCYKQAAFLGEAIRSVLGQTHGTHEVIVVDDGSPDHTADVAKAFPPVRYIRQENQGLSAARNTGIRHSTGSYLVFLDADDVLLPTHFESCLEAFRVRPAAAFVCGDYRWTGDDRATHVHDCRPLPDYYGTLLRTNFIGPPHTVMFRREMVLREGGFRVGAESCADQDIYLRMARRYPIHCHHHLIAEYRRHHHQMSQRWDVMLQDAITVLRAEYPHVKGHPVYEPAWQEGLERRRSMYGEPLLWATVAAARSGDLRRTVRYLTVLVRCYPRGLAAVLRQKATRRLTGGGRRGCAQA